MTAVRKHAHITRPPRLMPGTRQPDDVDTEPLSEEERRALAENDGTYVEWEALKAELRL
jgi:hypothetical protein